MKIRRWYRNKKMQNIDGYSVVCVTPEETGLPYPVMLDSMGDKRLFSGVPRLGVIVDDIVVPVSISEEPMVLSDYVLGGADIVKRWIRNNRISLIEHWHNRLSDREVLEALKMV